MKLRQVRTIYFLLLLHKITATERSVCSSELTYQIRFFFPSADPYEQNPGTGVGGRMLDMLKVRGYHTSANSVSGSGESQLTGDQYYSNPLWTVSEKPPDVMNKIPTIPDLLDKVKELNGVGDGNNAIMGEAWSSKVASAFSEYEQNQAIASLPDFVIANGEYGGGGSMNDKFKSIAQYIKSRSYRKVNRDMFVVHHKRYDHHSENNLADLFSGDGGNINGALTAFTDWLKTEGLWDNTAILMQSDFGRSLNPNSNGGTDHAWVSICMIQMLHQYLTPFN